MVTSILVRRLRFSLAVLALAACLPAPAQEKPGQGSPGPGGQPPHKPVVAVVLSGGSAYGMAHIGVLEAIEAAGIPVDMVIGTSMGSIVGGLYAAGYSPADMVNLLTSLDWNSVFMDNAVSSGNHYERIVRSRYALRLQLGRRGPQIATSFIEGQNLLAYFSELTAHTLGTTDFDALPVRYRSVATDLLTGEKVVIGSGSLAEAIRCSMSIPGLFRPFELGGRLLADGGTVDNLPVDVARELGADVVIAVESRAADPVDAGDLTNVLSILGQTTNIMITRNMVESRKDADLLIKCNLYGFGSMSYPRAAEIIDRGREAGAAMHQELKDLAAKIAGARPLVTAQTEPNRQARGGPPRFSSFRLDGGNEQDWDLVFRAFGGLLDRDYSSRELRAAIDAVYASGRFDLVDFLCEKVDGANVGIVKLRSDPTAKRSFFSGLQYRGIVSSTYTSAFNLESALYFKDFLGKNSAFRLSASLFNSFGVNAEYFQPIGPFFLSPWLRYEAATDSSRYISEVALVENRFRRMGGGLWGGLAFGVNSDLKLGYSYENVLFADTAAARNLAALRLLLNYDNQASRVFPESGIASYLSGRWASPMLGGDYDYAQGEFYLNAAIPLGEAPSRVTLDGRCFIGTDFSLFGTGPGPVSADYRSSLLHPGMFYGFAAADPEVLGNDVLGLSLELRYRLAALDSPLVRASVFGNLSAGFSRKDGQALQGLPAEWCVTLGGQFRLAPNLGLLVGLNALSDVEGTSPIAFALNLELGSFFEHPEDSR